MVKVNFFIAEDYDFESIEIGEMFIFEDCLCMKIENGEAVYISDDDGDCGAFVNIKDDDKVVPVRNVEINVT